MDAIKQLIDFILHIDKHLAEIVTTYGTITYGILFLIVFCETGLIILPFLPGDSLLFATGSLAAIGTLNPHLAFVLISIAAILGDTINYSIGRYFGERILASNTKLIKKEHIDKTQNYYDANGAKTIILARFIPIIRTFAPFVAGVGKMNYSNFIIYNVVGGIVWTAIFVYAGYFFGQLEIIKKNFGLVVIVIILISVLPIVFEVYKSFRAKRD
jgi:membrane-associated protein